LSDKLRDIGLQASEEEMESYFKKLRENCQKELLLAYEKAKKY